MSWRTATMQSSTVSPSTRATSALTSGVKPSRIIAHNPISKVLSVPFNKSDIKVTVGQGKAEHAGANERVAEIGN
jgi:hypothetical protein